MKSVDIGDGVHRKFGSHDELHEYPSESIRTLTESFHATVVKYPDAPFLGSRNSIDGILQEYSWETYSQVQFRVKNLASGMKLKGLLLSGPIGLFTKNRPECHIVSLACYSQSTPVVYLFEQQKITSSTYMMNHSEISTLFCGRDGIEGVYKFVSSCKYLKTLICFDSVPSRLILEGEKLGLDILLFQKLESDGHRQPCKDTPPKPGTLASIIYTSGTSGVPKGVLCTHANSVAAVTGFLDHYHVDLNDRVISYLPLAHSLERLAENTIMQVGGSIGFYHGNVKELHLDMPLLNPTIFLSVPRILEKMVLKIQTKIHESSWIFQYIFKRAMESKSRAMKNDQPYSSMWNKFTIGKFAKQFGNRLRIILTGGAPLRADVISFLHVSLGVHVLQGYGLSETNAIATLQDRGTADRSNVGFPVSCCEVKIVDVEQGMGEIWVRGANVSPGYFKDTEKTHQDFDSDGWFHTGDIGTWTKDGILTITDRKKDLFKLQQGEYISPDHLESVYTNSKYVSRIFIHGESTRDYVVGIVFVQKDEILKLAKALGVKSPREEYLREICENEKIRSEVLLDLQKIGKQSGLAGYEIVKRVHLISRDFDQVDCLTATLKLKRNEARKVFAKEIAEMYR